MRLKPKKCFLLQTEVRYLGHVVSQNGISTDPDKISAVKKWPTPQSVSDVRSFLGFVSYYRKFIDTFADKAKPLIQLTEKANKFSWGEKEENSFQDLKNALVSAPILAYPDPNLPFILDTDASNIGIGAVLSQVQGDEEKVIAYASRALSKAERNYCTTRKEMLAIVYYTKYFRHYLIGKKFLLRTDHSALRFMKTMHLEGQIARWAEMLQNYDFDLKHRAGKLHSNADGMSRGPCRCKYCPDNLPACTKSNAPVVADCSIQCSLPPYDTPIMTAQRSNTRTQFLDKQNPSRSTGSNTAQTWFGNGLQNAISNRFHVFAVQTRGQALPKPPASRSWVTESPIDLKTIQAAQMQDPSISEAIKWVQQGHKCDWKHVSPESLDHKFLWSQFPQLSIVDGVLVRILENTDGQLLRQIIVPPTLRSVVLRLCHDTLTAGHFGQKKTLYQVKNRFLWHGVRKAVEIYCKGCDMCAKRKQSNHKIRAPMQLFQVGWPLERVSLDIAGPYPESRNGNKYTVVVNDHYTRWVECYALPNMEAKTVAQAFTYNFVSRFGCPIIIHSDQGTQFESAMFQEMCQILNCDKTRTSPFHPAENSISERSIKTLSDLIATTCRSQKEWDKDIAILTMAYRATEHESIKYTPNFLMLGREVHMPIDLQIGISPPDAPKPVNEYVLDLQERMQRCHKNVRENLKKAAVTNKKYYDRKAKGHKLCLGDPVYQMEKCRKKGVCPKLQDKWKGPYLISKVENDCLYEIQKGRHKFQHIHRDLLKYCYSQHLPSWLKSARKKIIKTNSQDIALEK